MFIAVRIFSYAREGSESSGTSLRFDLKGMIELEGQITPEKWRTRLIITSDYFVINLIFSDLSD